MSLQIEKPEATAAASVIDRAACRRPPLALAATLIASVLACSPRAADVAAETEASRRREPALFFDAGRFENALDSIEGSAPKELELAVWIGSPDGTALYARNADQPFPAASAIKPAYLVELVDEFAGSLDEPVPNAADYIAIADHPAVSHFDADTRVEIAANLSNASVREVGRMMIRAERRIDASAAVEEVSNSVYNAAANLVTAALGGPQALTSRIGRRGENFSGIWSRRYMLAARDVSGDNEASASSLAAVLSGVASRSIPGVSTGSYTAIEEILYRDDDPVLGQHFFKSGSLDSSPLARILSGYWRLQDSSVLVYVIMSQRPTPGGLTPRQAGGQLSELVEQVRSRLKENVGADR